MQQRPVLVQASWRWRELQHAKPIRTFEINFASGAATAMKEKG